MRYEVITVNYNTPELVQRLHESIRKYLGDTPFRIIDGSNTGYNDIVSMCEEDQNTTYEHFEYNTHHGGGMHYAIKSSKYEYVLIVDSDAYFKKKGVAEAMFSQMDDNTHTVGELIHICPNGVKLGDGGYPYIHPRLMLVNKKNYLRFGKYINHGAPCINTSMSLYNKGYTHMLKHTDLGSYFHEDGRGTVSKFGYNLAHKSYIKMEKINILIRTSGRPNYFKRCYESIVSQSYKNINIIVSYDDDKTLEYLKPYHIDHLVRVHKLEMKERVFSKEVNRWRSPAPWNLYFNEMYRYCAKGLVMFLDDDDAFFNNGSLQKISMYAKKKNMILVWRVLFPKGQRVPNDKNWGKKPVCCNFSSIGFAFHSESIEYAKWDEYCFGDYFVGNKLFAVVKDKYFINETLTKVNREVANGLGRRDDID